MKNPLIYQLTEQSCGETAIFNCMSFLFEREEMPTPFLKIMSSYALGCYDDLGLPTNKDFCDNILYFAASWIKDFAKERHIPLAAKYLAKDDVNLLEIRNCLNAGGCVCLKTHDEGAHFVTVTGMDSEYMYIFDPYFEADFGGFNRYEVVNNAPFSHNRQVRIEHFISSKRQKLCLGAEGDREVVLFYKNNAILQREFV